MSGTLVVCATPIGNLEDITLRALEVLRSAGAVVCEDTRRSIKLLNHYSIKPRNLLSYHRYSTEKRRQEVLRLLDEGLVVVLITDSGTPVLSDPGADLIKAARQKGHRITVLPGASAITAALSISGLPADSFIFAGFLDKNSKKKREEIAQLSRQEKTIVLFEAPHRLQNTIADFADLMPNASVVIVRELTKLYEEVITGSFKELLQQFQKKEPRGEFTLVIRPSSVKRNSSAEEEKLLDDLNLLIKAGISPVWAVKAVSLLRNTPKKKVYDLMLTTIELKHQKHNEVPET